MALSWLQYRSYTWDRLDEPRPPLLFRYRLDGMPVGRYAVEFWSPLTGAVIGQELTTVGDDGTLQRRSGADERRTGAARGASDRRTADRNADAIIHADPVADAFAIETNTPLPTATPTDTETPTPTSTDTATFTATPTTRIRRRSLPRRRAVRDLHPTPTRPLRLTARQPVLLLRRSRQHSGQREPRVLAQRRFPATPTQAPTETSTSTPRSAP